MVCVIGQLLFKVDPYQALVMYRFLTQKCSFCFGSEKKLFVCGRCKFPRYCGAECQVRKFKLNAVFSRIGVFFVFFCYFFNVKLKYKFKPT